MLVRIIGSAILVVLWGFLDKIVSTAAPLMSAELSVNQLQNSDSAYVGSVVGMKYLSGAHLPSILLLVLLIAIWWKPVAKLFSSTGAAALLLFLGLGVSHAFAYCETRDNDEYVSIGSNETAFVIPANGANKDSQAKFASVDYYTESKIPYKRYKVPHMVLHQAGWSTDYYIPSVQVIIVDRTPVYRNFTDSNDTGTTSKKEGFHFESNESINIGTGVTVNGFVSEEDAAKFLYWFGSNDPTKNFRPTGDVQTDCRAEFPTVIRGRSLAEVMDSNVHGAIQAALANAYGALSTDDDIKSKATNMTAVVKSVTTDFASMGITLKNMGYSEALTFDQPVQEAINRAYIAHKDADRAATLAPQLASLKQSADIELISKLGDGLGVHGHLQLPQFWLGGDLGSILAKVTAATAPEVSHEPPHK